MLWGKKSKSNDMSTAKTVSGHVDDWQEIAVDYVDGQLDSATEAAVRTHLDACPECRSRLESQAHALEVVHETSLTEAPSGLEDQVLSEVLFPTAPVRTSRRSLLDKLSRTSDAWWDTLRPWMPAAAAVVVLLAVVVGVGVALQNGASDSARSADGVTATVAAEAAADGVDEESAALAADTTRAADDAMGLGAGDYLILSAGPPSGDSYYEDLARMVNGLASADGPAYFSFVIESEGSITPEQATAIAQQLSALTGLGPVDQTFSSGTRVYAAFVPTEDAQAVVDLLLSIGASLDLAVMLTLQPGQTISEWAESLLANKYAVAELDASPSDPPSMTEWTYTTSTSPATTAPAPASSTTVSSTPASSTTVSSAPASSAVASSTTASPTTSSSTPSSSPSTTAGAPIATTEPSTDQAETHVLVVILVGVEN